MQPPPVRLLHHHTSWLRDGAAGTLEDQLTALPAGTLEDHLAAPRYPQRPSLAGNHGYRRSPLVTQHRRLGFTDKTQSSGIFLLERRGASHWDRAVHAVGRVKGISGDHGSCEQANSRLDLFFYTPLPRFNILGICYLCIQDDSYSVSRGEFDA